MCNCLDTIPACDRQTDGETDDAMHMCRAVKTVNYLYFYLSIHFQYFSQHLQVCSFREWKLKKIISVAAGLYLGLPCILCTDISQE